MTTEALIAQPARELLPNSEQARTMYTIAKTLVESGFLPEAVRTPQAAFAIMQKGVELGIPPMHAFASISIIKGKPTCSAELILALIYRDHGDDAYIVEESTPSMCRASYKRRGWKERRTAGFTIEEAKAAGLIGKQEGNWHKYPAAMLRARCASLVGRLAFPDSIGGMHIPEELDVPGDAPPGLPFAPPPPEPADPPEVRSGEVLDVPAAPEPAASAPVPRPVPPAEPHASIDQMTAIHRIWERLRKYDDTIPLPAVKGITDARARELIAEMNATGTRLKARFDAPPTEAEHDELLALGMELADAGLEVPTWTDDLTYAGWKAIMATLRRMREEHHAKAAAAPAPTPEAAPDADTDPDGYEDDSDIPY